MLLRTNKIGIGCMLLASAMALGGFLLIDKYDDKKGFVSNVMEARYTVWKDCKKPGDRPEDKLGGVSSYSAWIEKEKLLQCDAVQLPYRWVLVLAVALFFVGVFVRTSNTGGARL